MPTCHVCGTVYDDVPHAPERCDNCGTFRSRAGTVSKLADETDQPSAAPLTKAPQGPDPVASIDPSDPSELSGRDLIRPRNISPEYSRHITQAWAGTQSQFKHPRETLNSSSSATADPENLLIGSRSMVNADEGQTGDYELREIIGEGAMGTVWVSARQAALDRNVAVKIPKPSAAGSEIGQNQFISEVVVTGQLDHPNIVPIYDLARDRTGKLFYSMKRVEGWPWDECMHDGSRTQQDNIEILMKVCDAIRFAHDRGVLHRDIKPHNVMVGRYGEVSVMDWGIALRMDNSSTLGGLTELNPAGTPSYMAPEMASVSKGQICPASDVYLLGAVLFEIITSDPPHPPPLESDNLQEMQYDALLIAARNEIIPIGHTGELIEIAFKALATDVALRYQRVEEFQAAIRNYYAHAESIVLAERGREHLHQAMANGHASGQSDLRFDDFDRARFAFEEAIKLWPENTAARTGLADAVVTYAEYAHQQGAYARGIALLDPQNSDHKSLLRKLESARRRTNRLTTLLQSLLITIIVVITASAGTFYVLRKDAQRLQKIAEESAVKEQQQREIAEGLAVKEKQQREIAEGLTVKEKEQREKAEGLTIKEKEQREIAQRFAKDAQDRRLEAEEASYRFEVGLVADEIDRNSFVDAKRILDERVALEQRKFEEAEKQKSEAAQQPTQTPSEIQPFTELRNWEWGHLKYLLEHRVDKFGIANDPVPGRIETAAISRAQANGQQWIAAGTAEGKVYVWNRDKNDAPVELNYGQAVHAVAFIESNGGVRLAVAGEDSNEPHQVKIWQLPVPADLKPDNPIASHRKKILSICLSKDGKNLLTCSADGTARLWDMRNPQDPIRTYSGNWENRSTAGACFSNDEQEQYVVAWGEGAVLKVWKTNDDNPETPYEGLIRSPDLPRINAALFSPDDAHLILAGDDGRLLAVDFDSAAISRQKHRDETGEQIKKNAPIRLNLQELGRHDAAIRGLAFSPNGKVLISASDDNTVGVWNGIGVKNDKLPKMLRGHGNWVRACAAVQEGEVLSAGYDGQVRLWDWNKYSFPFVLRLPDEESVGMDEFTAGAISRDAKRVATALKNGDVAVWNIEVPENPTYQMLREGHEFQATTGILFDLDGKQRLLTAGGDNTTLVWDAQQGNELRRIGQWLKKDKNAIGTGWRGIAAAAHNDYRIATGSDQPGILAHVWDSESGKLLASLAVPPGIPAVPAPEATALAFSPDNQSLLVSDQTGRCYLYETAAGTLRRTVFGHRDKVNAAAFLAGGRYALTASSDRTAVKWDLGSDPVTAVATLPHDDEVLAMDVSTDRKMVITACGSEDQVAVLRVWELGSSAEQPRIKAQLTLPQLTREYGQSFDPKKPPVIRAVNMHHSEPRALVTVFSPSNTRFPFHVGEWNWANESYQPVSRNLADASTALYSYGNANRTVDAMLAIGGRGARLWSSARPGLKTRVKFANQAKSFGPRSSVTSVAFSPNGALLACAASDGSLKLWQLDAADNKWKSATTLSAGPTSSTIDLGELPPKHSVVFDPKSSERLLSAGKYGVVQWIDEGGWKVDPSFDTGQRLRSPAQQAVYSKDGSRVLVVLENDVQLLNGEVVQQLSWDEVGKAERKTCAAFTPNGDVFVGTSSGKVYFQALDRITEPMQLWGSHSKEVNSITFSTDGNRLFTASSDFTVRVWDSSNLASTSNANGDAGKNRPLLTLQEHARDVTSLAFSLEAPNAELGQFLLSTGMDGQAFLWPSVDYPQSNDGIDSNPDLAAERR